MEFLTIRMNRLGIQSPESEEDSFPEGGTGSDESVDGVDAKGEGWDRGSKSDAEALHHAIQYGLKLKEDLDLIKAEYLRLRNENAVLKKDYATALENINTLTEEKVSYHFIVDY